MEHAALLLAAGVVGAARHEVAQGGEVRFDTAAQGRASYDRRFAQESVARSDDTEFVDF
ncbi:hypothetical protein [Streptomyces silvisoli]|uniref:Uncharacterized protein n=1 Tax=Streptomyces silvisoli TaxID=3034235 RepID=A0ABT5ZWU0_9ACTN|nr:hypothetical protein [Streptomyces silvisoli]MDF3294292.1 hypothetical protein [Streptomyces silvisoli]